LLGQQQRQAEPVCQPRPTGFHCERRGVLAAAMQQHDQRRTGPYRHRRQVDARPQPAGIGAEFRQDAETAGLGRDRRRARNRRYFGTMLAQPRNSGARRYAEAAAQRPQTA
jgi:hypothetical protein